MKRHFPSSIPLPFFFLLLFTSLCIAQVEDYADWTYSRHFILNTTASGAGVENPVADIPVLVRLTPDNFNNFAATADGGSDIRFSTPGGKHLPYQIERWVDAADDNDTADIWVLIDTVYGDNTSQSIVMHWGNPAAEDSSDGAAVFATANGFAAVYHLSEDGNITADGYKDATDNGNDGTGYSLTNSSDVPGLVGTAGLFDGTEDSITVPDAASLNPAHLTVSAWVNPAQWSADYTPIVCKQDELGPHYPSFDLRKDAGSGTIEAAIAVDTFEYQVNGDTVDTAVWQYVAFSYDGSELNIYNNGTLTGTNTDPEGDLTASSSAVEIGANASAPSRFFNGTIDEVVISGTARSADWIRLCYENQRSGQSLVHDASVLTWNSTVTTGDWDTTENWSYNGTDFIPWLGRGHTAVFDGSSASYDITVNGSRQVDSITVTAGNDGDISGGTLDFGPGSGISIADGTTTIGSVIDGSGGLSKYGSGTLRLSGDNTYTGTTDVTSGTLIVNGTITSTGAVTVATGATLGGSGDVAGEVSAGGATIAPGSGGTGKLTLGALTLNGSSAIDIELGTAGDTVAVTGDLTLDGSVTITPLAGFDAGTYRIATCEGTITDNGLTMGTVPAGRTYTITTGTDYIDIGITTALLQSEPADVGLVAGQDLSLSADATGEGTLTYLWQRSPDDSAGTAADLVIASLDSTYNGAQFRCIVTDSFSSDTSRWVLVSVLDTPRITVEPQDLATPEGEDAIFTVTLLDTAQMEYAWRKTGSSTVLDSSASFTIDSVTGDDEGNYYCTISNLIATVISDTVHLTILPPRPVARFGYAPTSGTAPLVVSFSDSSTGTITSREWDFGDGDTDTAVNPTHTYRTTGDYVVLLSVTGPGGSDTTDTAYVYVGDSIPVARFDYTPASGSVPLEVVFTDMSTGIITARMWDFGDGETDTAKSPTHTYEDTGSYAVLLAVEGPGGTDTTDTASVTVTLPAPVAGFYYTPESGFAPLNVEFTDTSTGVITSRTWSFGDGSTGTSATPQHTYTDPGTYSVTLAVTGPGGTDSLTVTNAITVTTLEGDDTLQSALELEELAFDSAEAAIRISWCIDSAQYADDLEVGVAYRAGTPPDGMDGSQVVTILERCTDTVVHLDEPILFDTVYHVALFLRTTDAPWPGPTSRARGSVPVGAPYRQDVTFDETNEEVDTVRIFNDRIRLREDEDFATLVLTDTVEVYDYTPPAGFTVTGTPIVFLDADRALPFYVGIRIRNLPAAASASEVRIYRVDEDGAITVEHESTVDTATGFVYVLTDDLSLPFIAIVDATDPQVVFSGVPDSVARAESSLIDTVAIRDNISNVRWTYLYSRGDAHPIPRDSGTLSDTSALVRLSISSSSQVISSEYGLRAILVVTDGVHYDTLDLSRAVYRTNSDEFITTAGIWHPIYPTARLYATDPDSAIIVRAGIDGEYDNRHIRLFRWLQHSSNETDNWLEYDPENSSLRSLFAVTPGRLFWIKTRSNTLIHLGNGRTISTRDTVTLELPAGEYTDFGLPFRFDIQLAAIFDATKNDADSLQVYAWKRDSSTRRYYLDRVYITTMADKNDPTTVLSYQDGGYSLFNPYGRAVVMRLPPTLAADDTAEMGKRKKADSDDPSWGTKLLLSTSHGTAHPAVYCGYTPGVTKGIFPVAPTFLQLNAFIFDRATGTKAGHAVSENAAGGLAEEVRIVNSSDSAVHLVYRFETAGAFPETYRTMLYDGAAGHAAPDGSIDLEPHSAISRWIVAGDNKYFTQFKNTTAAFRHGFSRIFPNPSRSLVNFRFSVGFGAQEKVRLTVFDLRGRKVWEKQMTALLAAGEHVITWNGYDRNHSPVGAGRYPVRLSFIDEQGKVTRRFDRMITLIP